MKDLEAILKEYGVEIPTDVSEAVLKEFHANYKTIAEFNKLSGKLDAATQKANEVEAALKAYDGTDPEALKKSVEEWKSKAEQAEKDYNAKLAAIERDEAIENGLKRYKFSSNAARDRIAEMVRKSELPVRDKQMLGFDDLMKSFQENDAQAFVTEAEANKPKFTGAIHGAGSAMTAEDIMKITDDAKRIEAIANNIELFE